MKKLSTLFTNFIQWLAPYLQTKRRIVLPVTLTTASQKLRNAFLAPIFIEGGLFKAGYDYIGRVDENSVTILSIVHLGKSSLEYSLRGELFLHQNGSQLILIVNDETPSSFLWLPVFMLGPLLSTHSVFIVLAVFPLLLMLMLLMMGWHRYSATNAMVKLLYKIIAGRD